MDAIRKKMQSLKNETDQLFKTISNFEAEAKSANDRLEKAEVAIRDIGKKTTTYESDFDETNDKLNKTLESLEEKEKNYKTAEE